MKKLALVFLVLFFGIAKVFAGESENRLAMQALSQMGEVRGLLERFMEGSEGQMGDSILCIADMLSEQVDSSLARLEEVLVARRGQSIVPTLPAVARPIVAAQGDVPLLAGRASIRQECAQQCALPLLGATHRIDPAASDQRPGIPAVSVSSSSAREREYQVTNLCIKLPPGPKWREKVKTCSLCFGAKFENRYRYKKHLLTIHGLAGWKCCICEKQFPLEASIRNHVRIHLGQRPYSCPICRRSFKQESNCNVHIKRHTKNETFGCGYCSKIFCTRKGAKAHQANFHSGQPEKIEQYQKLSAALPKPIQSLPGVSPHVSVGQLAVANQGTRQEMFGACIGRGALADEAQSVQLPGVAPGILPRADTQQAQATGKRCMCLRCGLVIEKANILGHTRLQHSEQTKPAFYELSQEAPAR